MTQSVEMIYCTAICQDFIIIIIYLLQ